MNKIIYQDSNEELMRAVEANGEAMTTLIETENGVKSAASNLISKEIIEKYRPTDSKTACIHLIAMGDYENYGFNRNGDAFTQDALSKSAHTFVTHGHMFREHRNKDYKTQGIGRVKYAAYDPSKNGMHRVELIVHMDKDKAEEEYEMAKKGEALNFSMSCRVPNDRCSICGNEAKNIGAYCDHLKHHMGQYDDEFKKYAFAYNDKPTFFDISRVKNPADRIARHLGFYFQDAADDIEKAASAMCKAASADSGLLIPSAVCAMAEGITDVFDISEQAAITKLASAESYVYELKHTGDMYKEARANDVYTCYPFSMKEHLNADELAALRSIKTDTMCRELAKRASILSFPAFCQYLSGNENVTEHPVFQKAATMLPEVFTRITRKIYVMTPMTSEFRPCSEFMAQQDPGNTDKVQKLMDEMEDKFSVREEPTRRRVVRIIIKAAGENEPAYTFDKAAAAACSIEQAEDLAECYAQYQTRALIDIQSLHPEAVTDSTYDMIAAANSVMLY